VEVPENNYSCDQRQQQTEKRCPLQKFHNNRKLKSVYRLTHQSITRDLSSQAKAQAKKVKGQKSSNPSPRSIINSPTPQSRKLSGHIFKFSNLQTLKFSNLQTLKSSIAPKKTQNTKHETRNSEPETRNPLFSQQLHYHLFGIGSIEYRATRHQYIRPVFKQLGSIFEVYATINFYPAIRIFTINQRL